MDDIRDAVWAAVYAREFSRWYAEIGVHEDEACKNARKAADSAVHYMWRPAHAGDKP